MNTIDRSAVLQTIHRHKIIVILRRIASRALPEVAQALYEGGIRLIEVTVDQSGELSPTLRAIEELRGRYADVRVGAGTVLTPAQLREVLTAGAEYIISPNTDAEVIALTRENGAVSIPGAYTPSEIVLAHKAGADFVKVFPADVLGPGYIKAVKAPLSHIPLLAVGGVDAAGLATWLQSGAAGVGVGGNILDKAAIESGQYDKITGLARQYTAVVENMQQ